MIARVFLLLFFFFLGFCCCCFIFNFYIDTEFFAFKFVEGLNVLLDTGAIFLGAYLAYLVSRKLSVSERKQEVKSKILLELLDSIEEIHKKLIAYSEDVSGEQRQIELVSSFPKYSNIYDLLKSMNKYIELPNVDKLKSDYFKLKDLSTGTLGDKDGKGPDMKKCEKRILKMKKRIYLSIYGVFEE